MTLDLHLIGGCGSSGSTLLAHLLDGLHDLRVGPEYGAFHHRGLYTDEGFERSLYAALTGRAPGADVTVGDLSLALVPAVFLMERGWYGVEGVEEELQLLHCAQAAELFALLKEQLARAQRLGNPFGWIDQTPKNCVAADVFLARFPDARFIHIVRDGRDVMASLARRMAHEHPGHAPDAYLTLGLVRWVHDVASARRAEGHPGYLLVRYEELVREPLMQVNRVLRHLGRPEIDQAMLDGTPSPTAQAIGTRMQGGAKESWTAQPTEPITDAAVGRWRTELPDDVLEGALAFRFTPPGWTRELGFRETLEELGYVDQG